MSTATREAPTQAPLRGATMEAAMIDALRAADAGESCRFTGVSWAAYERIMAVRDAERPGVRLNFDRGELEIMPTSKTHEAWKKILAALFETLAGELQIPYAPGGAATDRDALREAGLEPDECYHFTTDMAVPADDELPPAPPDLAIEVEHSRSAVNKLELYARLGVPEVWRYDGVSLTIHVLNADGQYRTATTGPRLPMIAIADLERFLARAPHERYYPLVSEFRHWVRTTMIKTI